LARLDFLLRHDPDRLVAGRAGRVSVNIERAFALAHQAGPMAASGDTSTAGMLLNVAGALANLSGDYERARIWLLRAIPLLIATGALAELESAVFNLALNLDYTFRASKSPQDGALLSAVLDLDQLLCSAFRLDRETIQTQILLASLAIRKGDWVRAQGALDSAEGRLAGLANQGEHGCYYECRAQLVAAQAVEQSSRPDRWASRNRSAKDTKSSSNSAGSADEKLSGHSSRFLALLEKAIACYEKDQRLSEAAALRKVYLRARHAGTAQAFSRIVRSFCEAV
jgi:hypothetical protein